MQNDKMIGDDILLRYQYNSIFEGTLLYLVPLDTCIENTV